MRAALITKSVREFARFILLVAISVTPRLIGFVLADLSKSLFQKFAPLSDGVFTASWHFMNKDWKP